MAFSLDDFMTEIRGLGVQRLNRFNVAFNPPSTLLNGGTGIAGLIGDIGELTRSRQLSLRCSYATFPGVQMMTKDDVVRYGYGPVDKTIHNALFSDIQAMFICDNRGLIKQFFHLWQMSAVNFDSSDTIDSETNGAAPYEIAYKDDYVTTLEITQLNELNDKVIRCTAQKAFPITVGDTQLAWEAGDQIELLPVSFSYRDHKIRKY